MLDVKDIQDISYILSWVQTLRFEYKFHGLLNSSFGNLRLIHPCVKHLFTDIRQLQRFLKYQDAKEKEKDKESCFQLE